MFTFIWRESGVFQTGVTVVVHIFLPLLTLGDQRKKEGRIWYRRECKDERYPPPGYPFNNVVACAGPRILRRSRVFGYRIGRRL